MDLGQLICKMVLKPAGRGGKAAAVLVHCTTDTIVTLFKVCLNPGNKLF